MLLDKFKENDDIKYIYQLDNKVFGVNNLLQHSTSYIILLQNPTVFYQDVITSAVFSSPSLFESKSPEPSLFEYPTICEYEWIPSISYYYVFISLEDWFKLVTKNDLLPWICNALPNKYKIKEYVKLTLVSNKLELRKNFDKEIDEKLSLIRSYFAEKDRTKADIVSWRLVVDADFTCQIIEFGKIIDLESCKDIYHKMVPTYSMGLKELTGYLFKYLNKPLNQLHKLTDDILREEKIKNYLENNTKTND